MTAGDRPKESRPSAGQIWNAYPSVCTHGLGSRRALSVYCVGQIAVFCSCNTLSSIFVVRYRVKITATALFVQATIEFRLCRTPAISDI